MKRPKIIEVLYCRKYFNRNAGCMIPAKWEVHVEREDGSFTRIFGHTRDEALRSAEQEFPRLQW